MKDNELLEINSPQPRVQGPHKVVYKHTEEGYTWAIVAMGFDDEPRLGIRWFAKKGQGFPASRDRPVWFVVPPHLSGSILDGLPLEPEFRACLDKFLAGNSGKGCLTSGSNRQ